jgi:hypothetical protein
MGILFISITVGIVFLAIILIMYFRKNKTMNKTAGPGARDVLEKETGKDEGIYD